MLQDVIKRRALRSVRKQASGRDARHVESIGAPSLRCSSLDPKITGTVFVAAVRPRWKVGSQICQIRVRYGYRRVHVLLPLQGWVINEKRTRRIYNEKGMQLRNKTPKRRVKAALRADRTPPLRSGAV